MSLEGKVAIVTGGKSTRLDRGLESTGAGCDSLGVETGMLEDCGGWI